MYNKQYLYKFTFPNGKVYIGCTNDIKWRWASGGKRYKSQKVYQAIQEFGWENIKREVILRLPEAVSNNNALLKLERELVAAYGDRAYNVALNPQRDIDSYAYVKERQKEAARWTIDGKTKTIDEWCEHYGKNRSGVMRRIENKGLTPKQALSLPPVPQHVRAGNLAIKYWQSLGLLPNDWQPVR